MSKNQTLFIRLDTLFGTSRVFSIKTLNVMGFVEPGLDCTFSTSKQLTASSDPESD